MKMMGNSKFLLFLLFMKMSTMDGFHISECCFKKEVGSDRYILVDEEDTMPYQCDTNCVYAKDSEPGSRYCFKTGNSPFYCVNDHAPILSSFTISEGNETIVQDNSFQNETGILELRVPPHKNYTETVFMLHQESKTSMLKTGDTCQLADLPEYINVSVMAGEFETNERMNNRVEESEKVTTFVLKARESRFGSRKRAELVPDVQYLCKDAPLVKTNDVEVNETEFEKYNNGEVIFLKNGRSSRFCEQETSCSKQGPDACGYGWTNPAGGGLSFHQVSSGSVCVTCNLFTDIPGTPSCNNDLCLCKDIIDKNTLLDCSIKSSSNTTIELKGLRTNLVQSMVYSKKESARSVVISSPAHKDLGALEVVMHGHRDGWWHEGIYSGDLKNNRMMKLGNDCHISTLPDNIFPVDIALGIQEIKAGNDVTTEEDEEDKHEILLDAGSLTAAEEYVLHSDIKSRCSGSTIKKFVETPVTKSQGEDLKNGNIIFLNSNPSRSNCELQTAATTNSGSGCWRWPNPHGATLWIHQIVHSVVHITCCHNLIPAIFPTCCEDSYPEYCQCKNIIDSKTFQECSKPQTSTVAAAVNPTMPSTCPFSNIQGTCLGSCGHQAPAGCWCDSVCSTVCDCCPDKFDQCPHTPALWTGAAFKNKAFTAEQQLQKQLHQRRRPQRTTTTTATITSPRVTGSKDYWNWIIENEN